VPVVQGDHIKGTLVFEKAGTIEIEYTVESIGAQQPMKP
jgi:copper(I)-binding protein